MGAIVCLSGCNVGCARPLVYLNSCDLTITATARSIVPTCIVLKDNARRPKLLVIMAGDEQMLTHSMTTGATRAMTIPALSVSPTSEPNTTFFWIACRKQVRADTQCSRSVETGTSLLCMRRSYRFSLDCDRSGCGRSQADIDASFLWPGFQTLE